MMMSVPFLMFLISFSKAPANLLLTLFRTVAFFEIFWLTTNPTLLNFKLFFAALKIKRLSLKLLEFLKIISKSFFFFILFILGSILTTLLTYFCPYAFSWRLPACLFSFFSFLKNRVCWLFFSFLGCM